MSKIEQRRPEEVPTLALALVLSSRSPVLLLNAKCEIVRASRSFCIAYGFDPDTIAGTSLAALGDGEWDIAQLRSLIGATLNGSAAVDAYELDFLRQGQTTALLVLNAQLLDYDGAEPLLILTITDITEARNEAKTKDDLIKEKEILLKELQHRVANSLQIIASVLLQTARRVQSEETRIHLRNAHHRVISIATLQRQLTVSSDAMVNLREYFASLCDSIGASMIDEDGNIELHSTTDDSSANANQSTSLGLIVTELVINALKHAFPGSNRAGRILVDYRATQGDGFALTVTDDGVGIAASDAPTVPGLGTGIVDALARHLGARVETSDNDPGTKVAIVRAA
ncbi:MAG: ATP-binding protein [Planctomycetes bacterium]|nr:ATP-binding protein [Planctomycetota bacterium]